MRMRKPEDDDETRSLPNVEGDDIEFENDADEEEESEEEDEESV